jgi:hypothetical protein
MMVLKLWDPNTGALTFDSTLATGGVFLDFYTVLAGGGEKTFPDVTNVTGIVLTASGKGVNVTSDTTTYGYLRFVFPGYAAGQTYALFAK